MKTVNLPGVLSATGGYVDTAGFLALQGLFTAHVTGNFVTLGAALAFGTSGVIAKLAALPLFCVVVGLVRVGGAVLTQRQIAEIPFLLGLQTLLLLVAAVFAIGLGPFPNGDHWPALLTGMTLVAAMAIQNAVHRIYLSSAPPTTLMTGSTTQIVIDAVDLLGGLPAEQQALVKNRISRLAATVLAFAVGCAAAAVLFHLIGLWCFALPPWLALAATCLARQTVAFPLPAH
ncbi:YoaK family protein [Silvimonas soli]|uniref:YoaK family protein n=1 Tax=Silvimonas soli TaxID=2980100 RepID=UPI0024B36090|nr:DUF1275 family protein [Silvimonas soli]